MLYLKVLMDEWWSDEWVKQTYYPRHQTCWWWTSWWRPTDIWGCWEFSCQIVPLPQEGLAFSHHPSVERYSQGNKMNTDHNFQKLFWKKFKFSYVLRIKCHIPKRKKSDMQLYPRQNMPVWGKIWLPEAKSGFRRQNMTCMSDWLV